uniref:Uncharacterized protein n=1 Tax=Caenorhabditis japonica TaxID=281687 RepID=A0A8R1DVC5_CAEJA
MGHSQSYDLRNPEVDEKTHDTVKGLRRVSKEHQTDIQYSVDNTENFAHREDELRDRIRREQLRQRENELESLRIRNHENRDPIIDAYRQPTSQPTSFTEFNYYDSLKHSNPVDPNTYFALKRRNEVNSGKILPLGTVETPIYSSVPMDPSPKFVETKNPSGYPSRTSVWSGRVSPLPRHEEVDPHPMPRYVPPLSAPRFDLPPGTYSRTTTVTTFTIDGAPKSTVPRYDEVPVTSATVPTHGRVAVRPKIPQYYKVPITVAATVPKYDEVPSTVSDTVPTYGKVSRKERPTISQYYDLPPDNVPKYDEVPPAVANTVPEPKKSLPTVCCTVPTYEKFYPKERSTISQYYSVPPDTVPKYDEVPSTVSNTVPTVGKISRKERPTIPQYDEVPPESLYTVTLPVSTNTTYSRKKIVPQFETVPTVPYGHTYSTPYDPRITVTVLPASPEVPAKRKRTTKTKIIPIMAEKLEVLSLQKEAEMIPRPYSERAVVYTVPIRTVPSTGARTVTPLPPDERLRRSSDVPKAPLDMFVHQRTPSPVSTVTTTVTYRRRSSSIVSYRTTSPPSTKAPSESTVTRQTRPKSCYSTPSPTEIGDYRTLPVVRTGPYGTRPVTPPKVFLTRLEEEVPKSRLDRHVAPRDYVPYPERRQSSSYREAPTVLYLTPLQREVSRNSLDRFVVHRPQVPYSGRRYSRPVSQSYITNIRVSPPPETVQNYRSLPELRSRTGPYGSRPVTPPIYLNHFRDEVPQSHEAPRELPRAYSIPVYRTPSPPSHPPVYYYSTRPESEVRGTPMDNYVHPNYRLPDYRTPNYNNPYYRSQRYRKPYYYYRHPRDHEHVSELHADKRMLVGIDDLPSDEQNVTYVKVADFPTYSATSSVTSASPPPPASARRLHSIDRLQRQEEVGRHPIHVLPTQSHYTYSRKSVDKETQYSRRASEDVKNCGIEHCTHVQVRDTPVVTRRTISEESRDKENRLTIFVDENHMENVVDLARDDDVGTMTSQTRRCFEEKLHYNGYMPTLSLGRRPIVSFYDKLH